MNGQFSFSVTFLLPDLEEMTQRLQQGQHFLKDSGSVGIIFWVVLILLSLRHKVNDTEDESVEQEHHISLSLKSVYPLLVN